VIGLIGVSGGKIWATKKIDSLNIKLESFREEYRATHARCHEECKSARIKREFMIESRVATIETEVGQRLRVIEDKQAEVFKILKEQSGQLSDQLTQLTRLVAWIENNGRKKT